MAAVGSLLLLQDIYVSLFQSPFSLAWRKYPKHLVCKILYYLSLQSLKCIYHEQLTLHLLSMCDQIYNTVFHMRPVLMFSASSWFQSAVLIVGVGILRATCGPHILFMQLVSWFGKLANVKIARINCHWEHWYKYVYYYLSVRASSHKSIQQIL